MPGKIINQGNGKNNMATFSEIAPNLARVKTETDIEKDFPAKPEPTPKSSLPELTDDKINAAYDKLQDIEANNGYIGIAHSIGLATSQVRQLHREIREAVKFVRTEKVVEKPVKDPVEEPVV